VEHGGIRIDSGYKERILEVSSTYAQTINIPGSHWIVLIEDNPADAFLAQEAIAVHHVPANLLVIGDGEEAIRLISRVDTDEHVAAPQLFLLDLNIPRKNGEEVLAHIRNSRRSKKTPVVIITSSDSPKDRAKVDALGANGYFRKSSNYESFLRLGEIVRELLKGAEAAS
jgi:CheY-like chemotaxis protein